MWWVAAYVATLFLLFVRFQEPGAAPRAVGPPDWREPLGLIRSHHRASYAVFLLAPIEALLLGGAPDGRLLGVVLSLAGVGLYRWGGATLGAALTPFSYPAAGAGVVCAGPYAMIRHPMYLGQVFLATGLPLVLGARLTLLASAAAIGIIIVRLRREDRVLRDELPGYDDYANRTKALVPYVL